jgi:hypothetical protein
MKNISKTITVVILFLSTLCLMNRLYPANQKRVYGKIQIKSITTTISRVIIPLRDFKIELLRSIMNQSKKKAKKTPKTVCATHPDIFGNFSFKDIPEGQYKLRISHIRFLTNRYVDQKITETEVNIKYDRKGRYWLHTIELITHTSQIKQKDTVLEVPR